MHRRAFLLGSIGCLGGIAGCAGIGERFGEESDDPAPARRARTFLNRAGDGDRDGARALLHPNATWSESVETEELLAAHDHANTTVDDVEVLERSDDRATVRLTYTSFPDADHGGIQQEGEIQLRRRDGEWLVYGSPPEDEPEDPRSPRARWEAETATNDDGQVTAVRFEHQGGDTIEGARLSVRAGGARAIAPEDGGQIATGSLVVAPLDGDGQAPSAGTTLRLVWADDGSETTVLTDTTIERGAAGALASTLRLEN